ncbi:transcription factor domain-containing protein [Aspergillus clavatus NRRL 1]|uniref:C6 transcription factor, putative n=1 Tax=Aspergillus clavatus (strain ATCC 1007 / CBS 513.65 / DSM 816 / NCTC 3887 / NRRL 1 / QM 1276 / 107) TaxID=344612 RepID=A1CEP4_ASPCL|nr:C6 transcription factor, putative [Aspergillus clavatus NRRL 1]EAW11343.1 C6 transcription factor, putative [Aspergillus clavatus NRRL 1]
MQSPSITFEGAYPSGPLDGHGSVPQASRYQAFGAKSRRADSSVRIRHIALPEETTLIEFVHQACESCCRNGAPCEVDESSSSCRQCMRRRIPCEFATRKEKLDRRKRRLYVKALKERLRKTESLLKAAGIPNQENLGISETSDDDESLDGSGTEDEWEGSSSTSPPCDSDKCLPSAGRTGVSNASNQDHISGPAGRRSAGNSQHAPIFRWDNRADSVYYGRSSSLSILSREGIEWIKHKAGEVKFLRLLVSDSKYDSPWDYWRPDVFHDVFASTVFKPLPPRAEVFSLLRDYFRTINRLFPLYHEASFMELVEWQYTQQTCDDAARWASINVILALAYEYRYTNSQKSEKDKERAWFYYKNAMSVFAELTLRRTDMLSVQALLGMALFLRGNSGTQSAMPLITAAIKSCHRMGLHRETPRPHLSQVEQEQRRRVFWVAFILDHSTCIRTGNAPTQHLDDFDVEIPTEDSEIEPILSNNKSFFQQLCRIAVIKGRIYAKLYCAKAFQNKTAAEVVQIVRELHAELEEWRADNTYDEQLKQGATGEDFLRGFASAGMQLVYYNSLILIHRVPLVIHFAQQRHLASVESGPYDTNIILKELSLSVAICTEAARGTLRLVNNLPWGDVAWIWSLLYYIFGAVMTIFINILRDSRHAHVKEDLQSLNMASTFFATLIPGDGPTNYARFMTRMSSNFERIARAVLEREQRVLKPSERTGYRVSASRAESRNRTVPDTDDDDENKKQQQESTAPHSSFTSSPVHSPPTIDIPHLPGLPRINSAGYVVPDSSPPASDDITMPAPSFNQEIPASTQPSMPPQTYSNNYNPNLNTTPTPIYPFEPFLPIPISMNFPQPDLWQIPIPPDWDPNQFGEDYYTQGFFQPTASSTGPAATPINVPLTPVNMGFPYGNPGNLPPGQGPGQQPMWPGGGFGIPYV